MKSQQELSDRLEIADLLTAYSYAIDFRNFDELDAIFAADATIDLTATGGVRGPLPEVKEWLARTLQHFAGHQHLIATSQVRIDGDHATARSICHNPMWFPDDAGLAPLFVGIWYVDDLLRTTDGWRITERVQQRGYLHGLPSGATQR